MDLIQELVQRALPENFDPSHYFMTLFISIVAILIIGGLFRLCFGKGSILNGAISSAIAILCLYVISAVIYSFGSDLQILFAPLPFVSVIDDHLLIFPIFDASLSEICTEVTTMIILSYLMNLLESWLPKGKKVLGWYCFRALSLILAVCLHYCCNIFLNSVLPSDFWNYAPVVVLGIVLIALLLGLLKTMVGGALAFISPILGFFYAFFFSKEIGKQLMRSLLTTLMLTILVCVLNFISITDIFIGTVAILTYLPVILLGLILWYVLAQLL